MECFSYECCNLGICLKVHLSKFSFCLIHLLQGLDPTFCRLFLPGEDTNVTLIYDKDETSWPVKFFSRRRLFSGGWIKFVKAYGFEVGQLLNFEVESPKTLRVRSYDNLGPNCVRSREQIEAKIRRPKPDPIVMKVVEYPEGPRLCIIPRD